MAALQNVQVSPRRPTRCASFQQLPGQGSKVFLYFGLVCNCWHNDHTILAAVKSFFQSNFSRRSTDMLQINFAERLISVPAKSLEIGHFSLAV
jgi:hypothetical protein